MFLKGLLNHQVKMLVSQTVLKMGSNLFACHLPCLVSSPYKQVSKQQLQTAKGDVVVSVSYLLPD